MNSKRRNRRQSPPKITLLPNLLKRGVIWLANNPFIIVASLIASFIGLTDIRIPADWLINTRDWARDNALSTIIVGLLIVVVFRWASLPIEGENSFETDNNQLNKKILGAIPEKPPLIIIVNTSEEALQIITKANPSNNLLNNLPKSKIPKPSIATEADVKIWKAPRTARRATSPKKTTRK